MNMPTVREQMVRMGTCKISQPSERWWYQTDFKMQYSWPFGVQDWVIFKTLQLVIASLTLDESFVSDNGVQTLLGYSINKYTPPVGLVPLGQILVLLSTPVWLRQDADLYSPPHCWTGKEKVLPFMMDKIPCSPLGNRHYKGFGPPRTDHSPPLDK